MEFYTSFVATIAVSCLIALLFAKGSPGDWPMTMLFLCIPYAVIGFIIWAFVKGNRRPAALGILLGGLTPFIFIFIVTAGCGLLLRTPILQ